MKDHFAELRSALHQHPPAFERIKILLKDASPEHLDYAKPLLDRLTVGNVWQTEASAWFEHVHDIFLASDRIIQDHIDPPTLVLRRGIELDEYTRTLWQIDARMSTHQWMARVIRRHFSAIDVRTDPIVERTLRTLELWTLGDSSEGTLMMARQQLNTQWPDLEFVGAAGEDLLSSIRNPIERGVSGTLGALASLSLGRMVRNTVDTLTNTVQAGTGWAARWSHQLLRVQWLIWMLLCATETNVAPKLADFARLAAHFTVLDQMDAHIAWDTHPLDFLERIEQTITTQVQQNNAVARLTHEAYDELGKDLTYMLVAHHTEQQTQSSNP